MANVLPSSSSLNDAPPPSLEKFACIFVQDNPNHVPRVEWYAFDMSDDPKLNQTLPPLSLPLRYVNPPPHHEDDESGSRVYLKPIATAPDNQSTYRWGYMWTILDNYLYRIIGNDLPLTQEFGANLVERICIKDIRPDSASKWEPVDSMPTFVIGAHVLVLGGKLYCLGGVNDDNFTGPWAVAYDPDKAEWQCLPDPPHRPFSVMNIFSASMEKSTSVGGPYIVVGLPDEGVLQIYNPDAQRWLTQSFDIKGSSIGPYDLVGDGGHPLAVDNKLYWYSVPSGEILCAYDLLTNVWSMARLPMHDEKEYLSQSEAHYPPYLAHLGSDKFCLFWVSLLPVEPRVGAFLPPKPEDCISRLHCLKFKVTNHRPNNGGIALDVSIMSCQSHLVTGLKVFLSGLGLDGHLGSISSDVRCPIPDSFENFEAPGSTVTMQEEMAVEVSGMKWNLEEYGGGSEPSSSKRYSSAPSHEEVRVLKNQAETLKNLCQRQEEKLCACVEQLENNSQLIDDQAKKIEQLKAFIRAHMQGDHVGESSSGPQRNWRVPLFHLQ